MNYMGSKNRLAKYLIPIIQPFVDKSDAYYEPFVGGANLIDKIKHDKKYGSDINYYLIELLKMVRDHPECLPTTITEEEYNNVKGAYDWYEPWYVGLVGFCATFGSKWFNGYARSFKDDGVTPRNHSNERIKNLIKQSPDLKGIVFKHCSYDKTNVNLKGFTIYCDPPYRETTKYKDSEFNYERFYDWCYKLARNNFVFVSEYNIPDERFMCIWEKEHKTNLALDRQDKTRKIIYCKKINEDSLL